MRRPRLLAPAGSSYAIYHCVSRVVNREKVFGEAEKEQFVKYMRLYAKLYGLRIITYCLMANHFH
ncbi:MAG: transposase, partial [Verrucomicrobiales bacterium]